ncbi:MAG TPA: aldehyde dehydrogenase family protein, partial [bacterium]|nr:aldehyde dehydrogenase family protein [bacterium]
MAGAALDPKQIASIVENVVARLQTEGAAPSGRARPGVPMAPDEVDYVNGGVFKTLDEAVAAATRAFQELQSTPLQTRMRMVEEVRRTLRDNVDLLSEWAVRETGLGRVEDKKIKNRLVIDKTPGPEFLEPAAYSGDDGLMLIERAPYGIIGSITPTTNPSETIICNGIGMLSGNNATVFNPHPYAKGVCAKTVNLMNEACVRAGGPNNCFTMVAEPTMESATALMKHKGIRLLVVTGGPGVVQAAMGSGKKAICGGPGNPPVVVDETADLDRAAKGIVAGHSLDNNIICTDEKEVIAVDRIADTLLAKMAEHGAYRLPPALLKRLESVVLHDGHANKDWIGKDAKKILERMDHPVAGDPRTILVEVDNEQHPFVQNEMLMPVLACVRVKDVAEGIAMARRVEHNYRHTAVMYSKNIEALHTMARVMDCSIFVKNAPNFAGLGYGGEGYTSFTIASPTGEGLTTVRNFT